MTVLVGTAGWSIPRDVAHRFPTNGSALERYAAILPAAEINSSFHRSHRIATWERWRDSVPEDFRFSVKLPKQVTHTRKLIDCESDLEAFLRDVEALGNKLAVLLVQLPPKLVFDATVARSFFSTLLERPSVDIACEPRHISWFDQEASTLLAHLGVARVGADPAVCDAAAMPGHWGKLSYWRLHGSPVVYRSSYLDRIDAYAAELSRQNASGREVWCIFDNTASSAATADGLALRDLFSSERAAPSVERGVKGAS
jgi:uncharacterized protein YecE (DUF72 family)